MVIPNLVGSLVLFAAAAVPAPEVVVDIDVNDEVYIRKAPITEAVVE